MDRASAGGMLKAIEIKATSMAMTKVSRAFLPLKFSWEYASANPWNVD